MNKTFNDTTINVPSEYLEAFYKVVEAGIERAKLPSKTRKSLREWWEVERCYIK